jgi:hypothetical protein
MAITFTQTGIGAGTSDRSRSDGLASGATVSISADISSSVKMLWRPDEDTTSTINVLGPTSWNFSPPAGVYGTYLFEIVDSISTVRRTFSIRTKNRGLRIPALNESANSSGSLIYNGGAFIAASDFNENSGSGPFSAGNFGGWYSSLRELFVTVDGIQSSDNAASYLVLGTTASLSNERAFTVGTGLSAADAGANSTYTLSINNNVVATVSGTRFTGGVTMAGGLTLTSSAAPSDQIIVKGWTAVTVTGSTYFMPLFQ